MWPRDVCAIACSNDCVFCNVQTVDLLIFLSFTMKSVRWVISEWLFIWWRFDPMQADTDDDFQKLAPFCSD